MKTTTRRCVKCGGAGKGKPLKIVATNATRLTACIYCGGKKRTTREIETDIDRRVRMLEIREWDTAAQSVRCRLRLGIPAGHHRVYGIDVPDRYWVNARKVGDHARHTLRLDMAAVQNAVREVIRNL